MGEVKNDEKLYDYNRTSCHKRADDCAFGNFFERGIAKVKIALAQGKTFSDKREAIKKRDWQRDKARLMAHYNSKKIN